jgi:leucyl-tRNA synthetase
MFDSHLGNIWTPIDQYVGGAEHATMHLLYARFIHKFLRDIGLVKSDEPFQNLIHQGTITNKGTKMSKSKGNVVNPDDFVQKFGSDVFRMYLMFMGPYELGGDWNDKGIVGVDRFVQKVYNLYNENKDLCKHNISLENYSFNDLNLTESSVYKKVNQTMVKFNTEMENFRFNTAVASLMELTNEITKNFSTVKLDLKNYVLERFALMLSSVAPHLGEECWQLLGKELSLYENPVVFLPDENALLKESVTIAVQVNGKLRTTLQLPIDSDESIVKKAAWEDTKVQNHTFGKSVIKEIYVKNKIYNIVIR